MLETVRAFALERLAEHPDAANTHRRHRHHDLALAERAAHGLPPHRAARRVLGLRGRTAEGLRWLDAALAQTGSTEDVADRVRAHVARANLRWRTDDWTAAERESGRLTRSPKTPATKPRSSKR